MTEIKVQKKRKKMFDVCMIKSLVSGYDFSIKMFVQKFLKCKIINSSYSDEYFIEIDFFL